MEGYVIGIRLQSVTGERSDNDVRSINVWL